MFILLVEMWTVFPIQHFAVVNMEMYVIVDVDHSVTFRGTCERKNIEKWKDSMDEAWLRVWVEWMFWSVIRVKFKWIFHRHKHSSTRTLDFNINAIMKWKVLLFIFPQISFRSPNWMTIIARRVSGHRNWMSELESGSEHILIESKSWVVRHSNRFQ